MLADLHVVSHLDEVIKFHATTDNRRVCFRTIDAGIGSDLDVVLDNDVAQLRNFVESALGVGCESEAVGADHDACVEDAAAAYAAALVNLHARVKRRSLADGDAVADIDLRVDPAAVADARSRFDHGEVAHVALLAYGSLVRDRRPLRDALLLRTGGVVHLQQLQYGRSGVVDLDERCAYLLLRHEGAVDQYDRGFGGVEERLVFRIDEIGHRTVLALLDGGDGVYFGCFVPDDFAAQKSGDHFGCKFHHSVISFDLISVRGSSSTPRRGAETPRRSGRNRALRGPSTRRCRPRRAG